MLMTLFSRFFYLFVMLLWVCPHVDIEGLWLRSEISITHSNRLYNITNIHLCAQKFKVLLLLKEYANIFFIISFGRTFKIICKSPLPILEIFWQNSASIPPSWRYACYVISSVTQIFYPERNWLLWAQNHTSVTSSNKKWPTTFQTRLTNTVIWSCRFMWLTLPYDVTKITDEIKIYPRWRTANCFKWKYFKN